MRQIWNDIGEEVVQSQQKLMLIHANMAERPMDYLGEANKSAIDLFSKKVSEMGESYELAYQSEIFNILIPELRKLTSNDSFSFRYDEAMTGSPIYIYNDNYLVGELNLIENELIVIAPSELSEHYKKLAQLEIDAVRLEAETQALGAQKDNHLLSAGANPLKIGKSLLNPKKSKQLINDGIKKTSKAQSELMESKANLIVLINTQFIEATEELIYNLKSFHRNLDEYRHVAFNNQYDNMFDWYQDEIDDISSKREDMIESIKSNIIQNL